MLKSRASLVAGFGIVLAIAIAMLVMEFKRPGDARGPTALPSAGVREETHPSPLALLPRDSSESTRDVVEAAPNQSKAAMEDEMEPEEEVSFDLHGRVVGQGSDGRELPPRDGHFLLTVFCGDFARCLEVEVHAGEWRAKNEGTLAADTVSVSKLQAGELQPRLVVPENRVPIPASHELEIRFRIPREAQLRVIDAASGAELGGVELVSAQGFPIDDATHPGAAHDARRIGRDLQSPIALEPFRLAIAQDRELMRVFVGAPSHAWSVATVDFDRGGEFVVALVSGGDLDLTISGVDARVQSRLRLQFEGKDQPACDEGLTRDGLLSLAGLAPGNYDVRVELGDWFSNPIVLGETTVHVRAGERSRAELILAAAPQVSRVDIGGLVYIASEWKAESPALVMDQFTTPSDGSDSHATLDLERIESPRAGFDAYRWARRGVEVGKYELGTWDPNFSIVIEVPSGGRSDFELVVPVPVELKVLLIDDTTGEEIVTDDLTWNPRRPEGVEDGTLETAVHDAEHHCYVVRAPAVAIELQVGSWDYMPYDGVVDLSIGLREHTIRLQPSCGVTLAFKDGDTLVAMPSEWDPQLRALSGKGRPALYDFGEFQRRLMVTEPGPYSIEFPKLDGYRQAPMQTIEVRAGHFTEHVVQLQREHP